MKTALLLIFAFTAIAAKAAEEVALQEKNKWNHISVTLDPRRQEVERGEEIRLTITYECARSFRAMNIFALAHNHRYPVAELRFFPEDGKRVVIPRLHCYAGSFPNREHLMPSQSPISAVTTVRGIPAGKYHVQLAVFDKISLAEWKRMDSSAKAVLFSNVVTYTIRDTKEPNKAVQ